ncbi:hypothetical protein ACQP2T_56070 [Nonomuraea sp. CA-143628]|uniref:hypothetical protein n=1 Tax=Nonomuraea sp. CA-143628 TaxID=3239997 RepID=UPI003D9198D9
MDGAHAIELEHQRRMVSLRAEGVIAILCPVASDTVAGGAIMIVEAAESRGHRRLAPQQSVGGRSAASLGAIGGAVGMAPVAARWLPSSRCNGTIGYQA